MPSIQTRRRGLVLGLASTSLVVATVAGVHAQDRSFWDQLFHPEPQPAQPVYQPRTATYGAETRYRSRSLRRAKRNESRPSTRYAALPKEDPEKITGKQPVDQKAIADNPTKAILHDRTLRAGDIVVLPSGPKVFTGLNEKRHRLSDFEDVKHSRMVDRKTRQQLLAMMVPVGAMPADQARKVMALKVKLAKPDEIAAIEADSASNEPAQPRVIMPWKAAR